MTAPEAIGTNKIRRFPLNISNIISTLRVTKQCHRLARGNCEISLCGDIQKSFGHSPSSRQPCLIRGVGSDGLQRSLPNSPFCDSTTYQKNGQCQCVLATSLVLKCMTLLAGFFCVCAFGQILSQTSPSPDSLHSLQPKVSINVFHKAVLLQCLTNFF